jgi:DNA modification methylase
MIEAFLMLGDCVDAMASLADQSVDAICTDPPYLIGFMGKDFDEQGGAHLNPLQAQEWHKRWATEAHRVLKPGGHLLAFGGTRTYHRLVAGIEDAGFEIRDCLAWMYGTGFPKSHDVGRSIDARLGAERTDGARTWHGGHRGGGIVRDEDGEGTATRTIYETPATEEAAPWCGWGTALKPAYEPVVVARKPLTGNVAETVLAYGTGALNIDACRVGTGYDLAGRWPANVMLGHHPDCFEVGERQVRGTGHTPSSRPSSAFAANAQPDEVERSWRQETVPDFDCHPDCPVRLLDEQSGATGAGGPASGPTFEGRVDTWSGRWYGRDEPSPFYADQGGASRFFYTSKAARAERNAGLEGFEERPLNWSSGDENPGSFQSEGTNRLAPNSHPTVKPVAVMRWLVRLVAPRGSVILDPFLGSGTTGIACALEGMRFVGIERDPDYMRIAAARIGFWREHGEDALRIVAERDAGDRARHARTDAGQLDLFTEGAIT